MVRVFCTQPAVFQVADKAVILSEALRRSIANSGLYGAKSKDPGDACWQMLLGVFRPQTTTDDKKSPTPTGAKPDFCHVALETAGRADTLCSL
jgi:hypothetical protein